MADSKSTIPGSIVPEIDDKNFLFSIGGREWEVLFVSQPPVDGEGATCAVMEDWDTRRLVICRRCKVEQVALGLTMAITDLGLRGDDEVDGEEGGEA